MPLTNSQYDALMRIYNRRQLAHAHELDLRLESLDKKFPKLITFREQFSENAAGMAKAKITGNTEKYDILAEERWALTKEKETYLEECGLTEADFAMKYDCPDCKDTGYVANKKCKCFLQAEIQLLYAQSNLTSALETENYEHMDWSLYDTVSRDGKPSQKEQMETIVSRCKEFTANFDKTHENLLFYGKSGLGKTFLSSCIAKELLDSYHSVLYFSSGNLFDRFSMKPSYSEDALDRLEDSLTDVDLLIIDDLGTEYMNAYTAPKFFTLINTRLLAKKSTIISTNLTLNQLPEKYGERTASRIIGSYEHVMLSGDDLRVKIKLRKMNH